MSFDYSFSIEMDRISVATKYTHPFLKFDVIFNNYTSVLFCCYLAVTVNKSLFQAVFYRKTSQYNSIYYVIDLTC